MHFTRIFWFLTFEYACNRCHVDEPAQIWFCTLEVSCQYKHILKAVLLSLSKRWQRYLLSAPSSMSVEAGVPPRPSGTRDEAAHSFTEVLLSGSLGCLLEGGALLSALLLLMVLTKSRTTEDGFPKSNLGSSSLHANTRHEKGFACCCSHAPTPAVACSAASWQPRRGSFQLKGTKQRITKRGSLHFGGQIHVTEHSNVQQCRHA